RDTDHQHHPGRKLHQRPNAGKARELGVLLVRRVTGHALAAPATLHGAGHGAFAAHEAGLVDHAARFIGSGLASSGSHQLTSPSGCVARMSAATVDRTRLISPAPS